MIVAPAVLALAAVFGAGGLLWLKSQPTIYSSESTVILLVDQGTKENPYSYFPKSVILTGQIVATRLSQDRIRNEIVADGGVHDYTILVQNDGNQWVPIYTQPTISIGAVSTDSAGLVRTQSILQKRIRSELQNLQLQAGAQPAIRVQVLSSGDVYALHGRPSRALLAIGVLSLWFSALIVRALRRWRLRRQLASAYVPLPSAFDREEEFVRA